MAESIQTWQAGQYHILAADPRMVRSLDLVRDLAQSQMPVLVSGETGVGKELVATALHAWSPRADKPFVTVSCAAVTESLLEAEHFGHEKGAFTGAHASKPGLFALADGGTLLLDEIGEASARVQAELLRVLEMGLIRRVGGTEEYSVDVRVVAATNRDLRTEIETGGFRKDLFYRLCAATVEVPPLVERPLDIAPLARRFLAEACARLGHDDLHLAPDAVQRLTLHRWPGNVREIRNLMELLAATIRGREVTAGDLPEHIASKVAPWLTQCSSGTDVVPVTSASGVTRPEGDTLPAEYQSLAEELAAIEKKRMEQALRAADGIRNKAAALIGMPLRTFVSKMKKHALNDFPTGKQRGG